MSDKTLLLDNALCFPFPFCPDRDQCSRARHDGRLHPSQVAMNAVPYRVEGQACKWFVQRVEETV